MDSRNIKVYLNCKLICHVKQITVSFDNSMSVERIDGTVHLVQLHLIRQEENFLCFYCTEAES